MIAARKTVDNRKADADRIVGRDGSESVTGFALAFLEAMAQ